MAPRGIRPLVSPDDMVERELMRWLFGEAPQSCRGCRHLKKYVVDGKYAHKCKVYGSTDDTSQWAINGKRCGLFNKPWGEKPILQLIYEGTLHRNHPLPQDSVMPRFIERRGKDDV